MLVAQGALRMGGVLKAQTWSSSGGCASPEDAPEASFQNSFFEPLPPVTEPSEDRNGSLFPSLFEAPWTDLQPIPSPTSFLMENTAVPEPTACFGPENPFFPVPDQVGWSELPPPGLTEEELEPLRQMRYRRCVRARTRLLWENIQEDYQHFYSWPTVRDLGLGLGLGAILANTSLDEHFQDWYQEDVRSRGLDNFSSFWKEWGDGTIFLPAYAGLAILHILCPEHPVLGPVGTFGIRLSRAYLVGTPPLLFLQAMTGSSRPSETPGSSAWRPFQDTNGISGHAFIGTMPFITAAQMTDQPLLRMAFYLGSVFPVWSRVNDNGHYLSQACLGWWLAYLACRAVDQTETGEKPWALVPLIGGDQIGVGVILKR